MTKNISKPVQIGALARELNITTRTIRYYEEIGLMGKNERLGGSTRSYDKNDILRLKFILKMKGMGISLKEIQELSKGYKQRTGLAQALIHDPPVLVLDEEDPDRAHCASQVISIRPDGALGVGAGDAPPHKLTDDAFDRISGCNSSS